jgi:hypothetical protein
MQAVLAAETLPVARREPIRVFRALLLVLYGVAFGVVLYLVAQGLSYYQTPLLERPRHPGYWTWKSGGLMGHRLGLIGSSMMVLMLLYSVRKRVKWLRRLGPLSNWLDLHIFLGVIGPLLVVLHSAFKVHGLVALSFWSMIAVALSGVLGRYLYLQIPRTRAGEELTLADLVAQDKALAATLRSAFGLTDELLARLDALDSTPARPGLISGLLGLLRGDWRDRRLLDRFARDCQAVPPGVLKAFRRVALQKARTRRRILLWTRIHELFHYWHVIHKPFAIVMYLFMVVHVVVAATTGYGMVSFR